MAKITADKITLSICLTDIPKSAIYESQNGKKYLSIDILPKREPDQWGKTLNVALSQTKEQREAKAETVWLGNGKTLLFEQKAEATIVQTNANKNDEGLPF